MNRQQIAQNQRQLEQEQALQGLAGAYGTEQFIPEAIAATATIAATENILIAAQSLGLGAVWLGVYPREDRVAKLKKLLGLPDRITPLSIVSIGHPAEKKGPSNRFDESRIHTDKW